MKKVLALLVVLILVFSLFPSAAYADVLIPPDEPQETPAPSPARGCSTLPIFLIAAAVLVAALVLWRVLRKKA